MRKQFFTLLGLLFAASSFAQGVWTQKADLPAIARSRAVGFYIGNKGYIGMGSDGPTYYKDFWEWDQPTNTWTPKADFGGGVNAAAVGFSIGTKGYVGTGGSGVLKKDFWEWDQPTNTWTQKADFPGTARAFAVGFSIGTKGYIGTGIDSGGNSYKDFWEWDQIINTWEQKINFAGTDRAWATAFSIGTKGYIGTGVVQFGFDFMLNSPILISISDIATVRYIQCDLGSSSLRTEQQENNADDSKQPVIYEPRFAINIYPNPNTGTFNIDITMSETKQTVFELYDLIGKKQFASVLQSGKNTLNISEEQLTDGVYFYRLNENGNAIRQEKLVVLK